MKTQVVRVALLQNAKMMAALYFVMAFPLALIMALSMLWTKGAAASVAVAVLAPLLYCACGFVFTLFGAWVYNLVAARVGGFQFTTAEIQGE